MDVPTLSMFFTVTIVRTGGINGVELTKNIPRNKK